MLYRPGKNGIDTACRSWCAFLKLFLLLLLILQPLQIYLTPLKKTESLLRLSQRMLNLMKIQMRLTSPDIPGMLAAAEPGEPDDASGPVYQAADRGLRLQQCHIISRRQFSAPADRFRIQTLPVFSGLFGSTSSIIEELEKEADARISAGHTNEDSGQKHAGAS